MRIVRLVRRVTRPGDANRNSRKTPNAPRQCPNAPCSHVGHNVQAPAASGQIRRAADKGWIACTALGRCQWLGGRRRGQYLHLAKPQNAPAIVLEPEAMPLRVDDGVAVILNQSERSCHTSPAATALSTQASHCRTWGATQEPCRTTKAESLTMWHSRVGPRPPL